MWRLRMLGRMKTPAITRGDQTRQALIRAATRIIGQVGIDAASTRAIAQEANANQALINYHFGGKEGLYQEVISAISQQMELTLVPALDDLNAALPLQGRDAVDALVGIFSVMIDQFSLQEMRDWSRIITREQQDPTPAFEIIYERFMSRVLGTVATLITGASDGAISGEAARVRAVLFVGQILVFVYAPAATQRFLGWPELGEGQKKKILRELKGAVYGQFPEVKT
jgi:TetR/AcrR family transcriptional regulator, regulator of cefoperazone and chloramphenicol sensitivity